MQDVILLVSTSAIFIFGYFLMKKLDVFLENNWNRQETALTFGENSLRIGFSNPLVAGGLADAFETYGKQHPDVSIHIFSGEESELCRELETHKLDIIFLPENTDISKKTHYNARMVLLRCAPVVMEYADLPIEPITQNQIYGGMTLREFDIDAALKRNPQLILVDELAHTNAKYSGDE